MQFKLTKATRLKSKLRIGLFGPSGAGKTLSALRMAIGMVGGDWNKVALIDTERGSGSLYANLTKQDPITREDFEIGEFLYGRIDAPFEPEKYIDAIKFCEQAGAEVIIIDSMSHEWDGSGGCLEIHSRMPGNSFANWGKVTPRHNRFIDTILESKSHMICCTRTKQDYVLTEQSKNGKNVQVPEKVGLKGITRDGFEYELTVALDIDIRHNATSTKDRTSLFDGKPEFVVNEETGRKLIEWMSSGADEVKQIPVPELTRKELSAIEVTHLMKFIEENNITEEQVHTYGEIPSVRDALINAELENLQKAHANLREFVSAQKKEQAGAA